MTDNGNLFKRLDPPPGGAERLGRRIGQQSPRHAFALPKPAAAILGIAIAVFVALPLLRAPDPVPATQSEIYDAPQFDRLVGRRSETLELRVLRDAEEAALIEFESSDPRIRIYALN